MDSVHNLVGVGDTGERANRRVGAGESCRDQIEAIERRCGNSVGRDLDKTRAIDREERVRRGDKAEVESIAKAVDSPVQAT